MVEIKSERAKKLIQNPKAFATESSDNMRKYPGTDFSLWVGLERELQNVKKLSFHGTVADSDKVLLEAISALSTNRPMSALENLTLRECEAFLRDRNSEVALEGLGPSDEAKFKKFISWLRTTPVEGPTQEYHFSSQNGPFRHLKLVDKVKEIKAFLNSPEIKNLYKGSVAPELIDVDDVTVYVQVPYQSEREKALFEELHILGVSTFQEETLNFIPEA